MPVHKVIEAFAAFKDVPGWYGLEGAVMNEFFMDLGLFPEVGMIGDIAEIGVFEGRSAIHLANHCRPGQRLYLFDPYDQMPKVVERIRSLVAGGDDLDIRGHRTYSQLITETIIPSASVRFLRIDGNHTRRAIKKDLDVANRILIENGIVNLDDFLHPGMVGVTYGTFEWMSENKGAFEMILVGFSQAYLCRPSFINHYMYAMRSMPEFLRACGIENFSFARASSPSDCVTVGIHHREYSRDWLMSGTDYANPEGPEGRLLEY